MTSLRLALILIPFLTSCWGCGKAQNENPNQDIKNPTAPSYEPITQSNDQDLLLSVIYGGFYSGHISTQYLGDASMYYETRFIVHRSIPPNYDVHGGISFNGRDSFIAINDGFLAGLERFEISFWFKPGSNYPKSGTLVGSNWATANPGDWLLQIFPDGKLTLMVQGSGPSQHISSQSGDFLSNEKYFVRVKKNMNRMQIFVNDVFEMEAVIPVSMPENGSPLCFGANTYDRLEGMDYFYGTIGEIEIRKF